MADFVCRGCSFEKYPPCCICSIANGVSLTDILDEKQLKTSPYPVCGKLAQKIEQNQMHRLSGCNDCQLCEIVCKGKIDTISDVDLLEKTVLSDLGKLNIYVSTVIPDAVVATEVKVPGNSRRKRIDLVIRQGQKVFLIKTLQDIEKYPFYLRSYREIITGFEKTYPSLSFFCQFFIPRAKIEKANKREYHYILIDNIPDIGGNVSWQCC